jgi:diguanylate cyclase (GGDEF)-like protein
MGGIFGRSLRNRIALVAALLFLLGISLITVFVSHILHGDMQEMVSEQQLTTTRYIASDIDGKIKLRLDSLIRVAGNIPDELIAHPAVLQIWLEDRRAIHTLFPTGLMIIPLDGGPTLADTPRLVTRPKSFSDRDWFIGVTQTQKPYISKPLITRATGEPALVIAVPITGREGKMIAVLAGITPMATPGFLDLILGTHPGKHGEYQLIAPQSRLFALTSESSQSSKPIPEPGKDPLIDIAIKGAIGSHLSCCTMQQQELASIVGIPQTGWILIARQPAADAFEPATNTLRNTLLITLLISAPLLITLLVALRKLLQPFGDLADQLQHMADGNCPLQPVNTHATDEVADVAKSFNLLQVMLQEQEQRLFEMAHHDTLTGLPNRRTIMERLENELLRLQRTDQGMALLFLDLDGFKPVNDCYGHQIGDQLLIEIARRLKDCIRDIDTVARLGGDEFLILLSATTTPQEAGERVAQECINALQQPILINDLTITVGVSIGISSMNNQVDKATSATELVSRADKAMYQAKAEGRNRFALYPPHSKA